MAGLASLGNLPMGGMLPSGAAQGTPPPPDDDEAAAGAGRGGEGGGGEPELQRSGLKRARQLPMMLPGAAPPKVARPPSSEPDRTASPDLEHSQLTRAKAAKKRRREPAPRGVHRSTRSAAAARAVGAAAARAAAAATTRAQAAPPGSVLAQSTVVEAPKADTPGGARHARRAARLGAAPGHYVGPGAAQQQPLRRRAGRRRRRRRAGGGAFGGLWRRARAGTRARARARAGTRARARAGEARGGLRRRRAEGARAGTGGGERATSSLFGDDDDDGGGGLFGGGGGAPKPKPSKAAAAAASSTTTSRSSAGAAAAAAASSTRRSRRRRRRGRARGARGRRSSGTTTTTTRAGLRLEAAEKAKPKKGARCLTKRFIAGFAGKSTVGILPLYRFTGRHTPLHLLLVLRDDVPCLNNSLRNFARHEW